MTLTTIEKAAKLMGYDDCDVQLIAGHCFVSAEGDTVKEFNPLTNKADLVDLMCAVGIDVGWHDDSVIAKFYWSGIVKHKAWANFKDHPDKQTALAHAVVAVAVQIYDRREE